MDNCKILIGKNNTDNRNIVLTVTVFKHQLPRVTSVKINGIFKQLKRMHTGSARYGFNDPLLSYFPPILSSLGPSLKIYLWTDSSQLISFCINVHRI